MTIRQLLSDIAERDALIADYRDEFSIDGKEYRLVPVEAVREMLEAAHFGPNCAEDELRAQDEQFWIDVWKAMLATSPAPTVVDVSDEVASRVDAVFFQRDWGSYTNGRAMIAAVHSILGPTLGLVPREDVARMVESAYREGLRDSNQLEWVDSQYVAGQKAAGGWAMNHWLELRGTVWVMCDGIGCQPASDAEIEMWQELAKLRAECDQWREELRIYRETESAECEGLRLALKIVSKWCMGRGYSARVQVAMQKWIDAGSVGALPELPEHELKAAMGRGEGGS